MTIHPAQTLAVSDSRTGLRHTGFMERVLTDVVALENRDLGRNLTHGMLDLLGKAPAPFDVDAT